MKEPTKTAFTIPRKIERRASLKVLEKDWIDCRRCPLGEKAFRHVLWEILPIGHIDVLFVGEGPGEAEDAIGRPFIGRAGQLLRRTIRSANDSGVWWGLTNLVACRPTNEGPPVSNRTPSRVEVEACQPRLVELLRVIEPSVVVSLGRNPDTYVPADIQESGIDCRYLTFYHPSYICRRGSEEWSGYGSWRGLFEGLFTHVRSLKGDDEMEGDGPGVTGDGTEGPRMESDVSAG